MNPDEVAALARGRLSVDGSETLEDALRIFVETAGDEAGRRERYKATQALRVELELIGVGGLLAEPPPSQAGERA
jgi:hypothetical protein